MITATSPLFLKVFIFISKPLKPFPMFSILNPEIMPAIKKNVILSVFTSEENGH